jgi:hypothetical protein
MALKLSKLALAVHLLVVFKKIVQFLSFRGTAGRKHVNSSTDVPVLDFVLAGFQDTYNVVERQAFLFLFLCRTDAVAKIKKEGKTILHRTRFGSISEISKFHGGLKQVLVRQ